MLGSHIHSFLLAEGALKAGGYFLYVVREAIGKVNREECILLAYGRSINQAGGEKGGTGAILPLLRLLHHWEMEATCK